MSLAILAEALARLEHKVDAVCKAVGASVYPMHFSGNTCPSCSKVIDYQIDVVNQVVVRRCDCTTGKVPSAIPLLPVVQPGVKNGYPTADEDQRADGTEEGSRSKAR